MKRRNKKDLEIKVERAKTKSDKAVAYLNLALFHDNNSREAEAIPNYRQAIRLGLKGSVEAEARAWLASSLYKTKQQKVAIQELHKSRKLTKSKDLLGFLDGLEKRIQNS